MTRGEAYEYLGIPPNWHVGMAFAKTAPARPLLKPIVLEFFGAANKKGRFFTGGAASCLVQERKAENEECL